MSQKLFYTNAGTPRSVARDALVAMVALVFVMVLAPRPAQAQTNTFVINSLGDAPDANTSDGVCQTTGGDCTLRAAIQQANATANTPDGSDEIYFGITGAISLTGPLPDLSTSMDIVGTQADSGNTILRSDNTGNYRIFNITNNATVGIENLTLSNGVSDSSCGGAIYVDFGGTLNLTGSSIIFNQAPAGGGICNGGTTNIKGSTLGSNFATSGAAHGGGVDNVGNLSVVESFFNANHAGDGGGIYNLAGGTTVVGSTFRNNTASRAGLTHGGGGIFTYNGGGSVTNSTFNGNSATAGEGGGFLLGTAMSFVNDTIAGNSAGSGGGISEYNGATLQNTLVAKNTASSRPDLSSQDGGSFSFRSKGNNLIGDASGSSGFTDGAFGDQVGSASDPIDPKLQSDSSGPVLQDNGGPTQTIALLPGSPAIDAGSDSVLGSPLNLTTDQRGDGFPREQGAHVDIGAFETPAPSVSLDAPADGSSLSGTNVPLSATARETGGIREVAFLVDGVQVAQVGPPSSGNTYEATLDTTAYSDGTHTITARAIDTLGYTSVSSHAVTINNTTVDTTAPTLTSTTPTSGTTGVAPSINVTATFSEAMEPSSLSKRTFKLYKKGSTTAVGATVSYSSTAHKAILNPTNNLRLGTTYKAVVTTGAKDLAGNPLAQKTWHFTIKR